MNVKVIAFHLPQYHTIPENDKWWGKGFTEWTNLKKASPLFKGHNQPRQPLDDNYYNLLDENNLKWQFDLAQKYNIYGFCYYHYWFDGKLLLEKPLELMLNMTKKINYCMCWANEPWTRTWDGHNKDILIDQSYGQEKDWKKHINYLLPFFKDSYYIKKDNKPIFILYRTNNIPNCEEMIECWDKCCKQEGFDGIYVIEEKNAFQPRQICHNSAGTLDFEPVYTMFNSYNFVQRNFRRLKNQILRLREKNKLDSFNYDRIWESIIHRKHECDGNHFLGAFTDWDNTPRKGKKGIILRGACPQKFEIYFSKQVENCKKYNSEFLFFNAWNEWTEGTYLEPDKENKYVYLEIIKKIISDNDK